MPRKSKSATSARPAAAKPLRRRDEEAEAPKSEPTSEPAPGKRQPPPPPKQRRWGLLALLLLPALLPLLVFAGDRLSHQGRVLRGVKVAGRSLGGLDRPAAERAVTKLAGELRARRLQVQIAERRFELDPDEVALAVPVGALVDAALSAGRQGGWISQLGWWLSRWRTDVELPLQARLDRDKLAAVLSTWEQQAVDEPPFEGAVVMKNRALIADEPRAGRRIDRDRAERLLSDSLLRPEPPSMLQLPLSEIRPQRSKQLLAQVVEQARELVSGAVILVADAPAPIELPPPKAEPDREVKVPPGLRRNPVRAAPQAKPKPATKAQDGAPAQPEQLEFRFEPAQLMAAIRSRLRDEPKPSYELYFEQKSIEPLLKDAKSRLEAPPIDAAFVIDKQDKPTILPSRDGTAVDAAAVVTALLAAARSPDRRGPLPIKTTARPSFTTEQAEALKITGLVSKFTTMHPCCHPRVENIHLIADLIDGVIVPPGATFSINEWIGERTTAKGFVPAPTIVEGEMEDTIGGGISQFATTFFNAAFHGGYAILERTPHSFYFSRYPMGHEATLSYPKPDLVIKNDTEAGLLIKASYTSRSITLKFFGDNGGRKVRRKVSPVFDLTEPPIEYIPDRTLEPDETKVKEKGKQGWSVEVSRKIIYPNGEEQVEARKVIYKPRPRKLRVHPCKIPEGAEGHTGEKCPEPEEKDDEDGPQEGDKGQPKDKVGPVEDIEPPFSEPPTPPEP